MARDMYKNAHKRTVRDTKEERDNHYGVVYDEKNNKRIQLFWDLSDEAKEDSVFMMRVDGNDYLIDANQMMKFLRWV